MSRRRDSLPGVQQVISRIFVRLVLLAVAVSVIAITFVGGYLMRGYANEVMEIAAQTISYSVEPAMVFGDKRGVIEAIDSVGNMETVRRIDVLDANGRPVAEWVRPETGPVRWLGEAVDDLFLPDPRLQPINHSGERIGMVRLYGSSGQLLGYVATGIVIATLSLAIALVAMQLMARQLRRDISQPLEGLAAVADAVRYDRAFHRRAQPAGIAEIDRFSRDFNALLAELEGWHGQITAKNQELAHRVEHDPLTGLGNRSRFQRVLSECLASAQANLLRFSILFIDLDRFKAINDTYGHHVGDVVLCEVARRLLACVRGTDHVFRLGGDEFAIILDPSSEGALAKELTRRIEASMASPLVWEKGVNIPIEMSIGAATFPDQGEVAKELVEFADTKMYLRKRGE